MKKFCGEKGLDTRVGNYQDARKTCLADKHNILHLLHTKELKGALEKSECYFTLMSEECKWLGVIIMYILVRTFILITREKKGFHK